MPSRARSWRREGDVRLLVGTIPIERGYVEVKVHRERGRRFASIVLERQRVPGVACEVSITDRAIGLELALEGARATVLAKGGRLADSAEALHCCRVPDALAKSMFTEIGMARFVHAPIPRTEG